MSDALQEQDLLKDLQSEIVLRLQEDPQLFGPPRILVIAEDFGDIEAEIRKGLGPVGSNGGCIIVHMPEVVPQDQRRPFIMSMQVEIECVEHALINRSSTGNQIRAMRLGEIVHILLRNWVSSLGWSPLQRTTIQSGKTSQGWLGYRLTFAADTVYDVTEVP